MTKRDPLILTLKLDDGAQVFFNNLRRANFPPARNYLDAHLTLFHQLPPDEPLIWEVLQNIAQNQKVITLAITDIKSIGNGVAYKIESEELMLLHHQLQRRWQHWLIPQDQQKLWPHITVQNKVDAETAKDLLYNLLAQFSPFNASATGLSLWKYKGGPWEFVKTFLFAV